MPFCNRITIFYDTTNSLITQVENQKRMFKQKKESCHETLNALNY